MAFIRPARRTSRRPYRIAMNIAGLALIAAGAYAVLAWHRYAESAHPARAGEPLNPYVTAAHVVVARTDALVGDARGAQSHVQAISHDLARSTRIPDVARPIDHESARAAARAVAGTRSAIWLDHDNFAVMVDGPSYRTMAMIDSVCRALDPLGDTLAVVVHVQDATATTADAAATLSRNCQLPEGERAFMQARRNIDVVSPDLRAAFKAQQAKRPP